MACIPGESGDGFGNDHVNLARAAVLQHLIKIIALCGLGTASRFICVDTDAYPAFLLCNQAGVIIDLRFKGILLVRTVGTHAAVGAYPDAWHFMGFQFLANRLNSGDYFYYFLSHLVLLSPERFSC